ncbi:MAG: tRNA (adenosine(37)-N6)-threonylcarbamoyltransferase complex dimerization subunit type 1 TsaB [Syntrophomonadaceae bacterium]
MLILAIDSSTPVAGVALIRDELLVRESFINFKQTHSELLMPLVDQTLQGCGLSVQDLDALAVTLGPGSFTGLRIGMAAVKGLSLAAGLPVVGLSTLETLAHNICFTDYLVCPLLNARRQEVYGACYDNRGSFPRLMGAEVACPPEEFARLARQWARQQGRPGIIMLGDGYAPYREIFKPLLGDQLQVAPAHMMLPRAAALGSLAMVKAGRGEYEPVMALRPRYIRLSEAERKLGKGEL